MKLSSGIVHCVENYKSVIAGPSFPLLEIHFFENCGELFICNEGCIPERFVTYAQLSKPAFTRFGSIWIRSTLARVRLNCVGLKQPLYRPEPYSSQVRR